MADFTKVYEIRFNTKHAEQSLTKLKRKLASFNRTVLKMNKGALIAFNGLSKGAHDYKRSVLAVDRVTDRLSRNIRNKIGRDGSKSFRKMANEARMANRSVNQLGRKQARSGGRRGPGLGLVGVGSGAIGVYAAQRGMRASIGMARTFNKSMAEVSTLIPGNAKRIQELRKAVMKLAEDTGKPLEDLTGGLYQTISAFGDNEDTMKRLEIATRASVAGVSSTEEALNLLSAVTKGYGDTSEEATKKASDLAFETVKLGQTTFPELAASMGRVIPLAAGLGSSQEELFATMATLTGVTGNTAEVSTQLASIYTGLLKPTEAMTKLAKKNGFESAAQMVKVRGLARTFDILKEETKGNEQALGELLGRKEGIIAMMALSGGSADTFKEKLLKLKEATGTTDTAYREMIDGVDKSGHKIDKAEAKFKNFATTLGEIVLPVLGDVAEGMANALGFFERKKSRQDVLAGAEKQARELVESGAEVPELKAARDRIKMLAVEEGKARLFQTAEESSAKKELLGGAGRAAGYLESTIKDYEAYRQAGDVEGHAKTGRQILRKQEERSEILAEGGVAGGRGGGSMGNNVNIKQINNIKTGASQRDIDRALNSNGKKLKKLIQQPASQ